MIPVLSRTTISLLNLNNSIRSIASSFAKNRYSTKVKSCAAEYFPQRQFSSINNHLQYTRATVTKMSQKKSSELAKLKGVEPLVCIGGKVLVAVMLLLLFLFQNTNALNLG